MLLPQLHLCFRFLYFPNYSHVPLITKYLLFNNYDGNADASVTFLFTVFCSSQHVAMYYKLLHPSQYLLVNSCGCLCCYLSFSVFCSPDMKTTTLIMFPSQYLLVNNCVYSVASFTVCFVAQNEKDLGQG